MQTKHLDKDRDRHGLGVKAGRVPPRRGDERSLTSPLPQFRVDVLSSSRGGDRFALGRVTPLAVRASAHRPASVRISGEDIK